MTAPAQVPASGTRIIADYAINPLEFREDTYMRAMEVLPSNRTVTHHAIVNVKDGAGTQRIGGYQPGGATTAYPDGLVRMIPKGASLALNMHYNPKGTPQEDTRASASCWPRGRIDKVVRTAHLGHAPARHRAGRRQLRGRRHPLRVCGGHATSSACCRA